MQNLNAIHVDTGHMRVSIGTSKTSGNPVFALFVSEQYKEPGGYVSLREEAGKIEPIFAIEIERKEQALVMLKYLNRIVDQYF